MPRTPIVLAAGLRTPWCRAGGAFAREDSGHLGALVGRELLARSDVDPAALDEVIAGCVGAAHDQANVARVIGLRAGVPRGVPARTVARNCASGMEAVTSAAASIEAGRGDLYLCIGVEVMSAYPLIVGERMTRFYARLSSARSPLARVAAIASFRPSMLAPRVALMEGLTDPISGLIMGKTAEILAREFGISREDADKFALESHQRAKRARDSGRFAREILPVLPLDARGARGGEPHAVENDDSIRDEQSLPALAKLRPYFEKPDGRVTVGNSCGITDGACALLVASEDRARALGLAPIARIVSWAYSGCDPERMGLGPVYSSARALDDAGLALADMETIEINEAFAAQVLACAKAFASDAFAQNELHRGKALGVLDMERTNRNGGAIALGHPVGATGARLLLTTAHELAARKQRYGLATACIGGGQGAAVVLERMDA
ncbi:MAG TPA: acetyl-CoA C-acyltransferase [Planctomycetota bacterium]|jgi:acetyl-CoA C-acetyltransferase/acetyl-CoA acyltransferase|nr:acetyl-CoA C-acyltransferase [Planctomycetota bacterium]